MLTAPRLVIAACYRELGEKMKLLWTKDLQMNTVHVSDVARGAWHVATAASLSSGSVYNLADKASSSESLKHLLNLLTLTPPLHSTRTDHRSGVLHLQDPEWLFW